jgi:hypothetical protein
MYIEYQHKFYFLCTFIRKRNIGDEEIVAESPEHKQVSKRM